MRLLLDTCVWGGAKPLLQQAGHNVIWGGDWDEAPGDEEILRHAHREKRVLVTLDKDFGELAVVRQMPHSGIVRLVGFSGREQGRACLRVLDKYQEELESGALVTVDSRRIRVRPAE